MTSEEQPPSEDLGISRNVTPEVEDTTSQELVDSAISFLLPFTHLVQERLKQGKNITFLKTMGAICTDVSINIVHGLLTFKEPMLNLPTVTARFIG